MDRRLMTPGCNSAKPHKAKTLDIGLNPALPFTIYYFTIHQEVRLKRFPPGFFETMVDWTTTELRRLAPARR